MRPGQLFWLTPGQQRALLALLAVALLGMAVGGTRYYLLLRRARTVLSRPWSVPAAASPTESAKAAAGVAAAAAPAEPAEALAAPAVPASLLVHVAGAVAIPGVYDLPMGARVIDAVAVAGGALAGAELNALNLAAPLSDGVRIYVPTAAEVAEAAAGRAPPALAGAPAGWLAPAAPWVDAGPAPGDSPQEGEKNGRAAAGKTNLNRAGPADLEGLPHIGPAMAERIIAYRQAAGGFRSIDDLLNVPGIGAKRLADLRPLVTVE